MTIPFFLLCAAARAVASLAIEIDLAEQKAHLLMDGQIVYESRISSGRAGFPTRAGNFTVIEKDADHFSSLYGQIIDAQGRVLVGNADSDMPVPKGAKFVRAPMKHFLRFDGATGLHAGYLPGHPASHGCVRLPPGKAELFFNIAQVGTPVRVFGTAPGFPAKVQKRAARPAAIPPPGVKPAPRKWWFFARKTAPSPQGFSRN